MEQNVEQKIIDAARDIFYDKGYDGTKMRDIAKTADVNLALLHYYFRTKNKIFSIVFDEAFDILFKKIDKALTAQVDFFEQLRLLIYAYVDTAIQNPQLPMFVLNEASKNPKYVTQIMEKHKQKFKATENLNIFFERAQKSAEEGIIKPINPWNLFIDILSLTLFPFMAKGLLDAMFGEKKMYKQLLKNRKPYIADLVIESLKP